MKKTLIAYLFCLLSLVSHSVAAASPSLILENQIIGTDGEILRNIQESLDRQQAQYTSLSSSEIQHFYQQSPKFIQQALQPFGYFKTQIHSSLTHKGNRWVAHHRINLGPTLKITSIHLSIAGPGKQDTALQQSIAAFPLHSGDVFATKSYSQAKQFLIDHAVEASYIKAYFRKNQVNINLARYRADIFLELDTGPRYFFGPVYFSPTHFSENFLKQFVNFKMSEPYNASKLKDLQQRFNDSNYFREVEITPNLDKLEQHEHIPIKVKLKPTKSKEYLMGIGYGTDTGARSQLSFKFPQLGQKGHQVKGLIKASNAYSKLMASYSIPGADPVKSHYTLSASMEHQSQNIGKSTTAALVTSYDTKLKNNWEQTLSLNLMNDRSTIVNQNVETSNLLLFPSIHWLKLKSDDLLNPTKGYRLVINLLGSPKTILATRRFLQAQVSGKSVNRLSKNNRLVLHGTIGHTEVSDLNRLPLSLRFYTGGSQSLRAYSYRSIGPGRQLLEASAEIQHQIYKNWYIGIFYDAGNISDKLLPTLKRGLGTGLIWLSPVGAIQLSLAKALDAQGQPLRIQFNMGPDL